MTGADIDGIRLAHQTNSSTMEPMGIRQPRCGHFLPIWQPFQQRQRTVAVELGGGLVQPPKFRAPKNEDMFEQAKLVILLGTTIVLTGFH